MEATQKITAEDVANFFLCCIDEDAGDNISNLKLQKFLYYAQGFHLAMFGVKLFDEPVKAWTHGPVVESIYHKYKGFGAGAIPEVKDFDLTIFTQRQADLLQ